jgi:hypothetical protein
MPAASLPESGGDERLPERLAPAKSGYGYAGATPAFAEACDVPAGAVGGGWVPHLAEEASNRLIVFGFCVADRQGHARSQPSPGGA